MRQIPGCSAPRDLWADLPRLDHSHCGNLSRIMLVYKSVSLETLHFARYPLRVIRGAKDLITGGSSKVNVAACEELLLTAYGRLRQLVLGKDSKKSRVMGFDREHS